MNKYSGLFILLVLLCGCEGFRRPATQAQKQNAWLHLRTAQLAAEQAVSEQTSALLQDLTALSCQQSCAFAADYGLPKEMGSVLTAQEILAAAGPAAVRAQADSSAAELKPWSMADGLLDLGLALAGLLGGAWGLKAAAFFRQAREKSDALKEIVRNNELFKTLYPDAAPSFKQAQSAQSPSTRRLVAELKTPAQ
ncbi:MAG TPA: hypothetical protein PK054_09470 [Anaerohalosphaeraceae bacterium]|nr:hypothetical protein [Anaerohalosphaeraceae bacterium]HOL89352.1 hypothetical protein [Anaerohalosphaeraceae bacterium]HPP56791.1 hypothetical protein [Anaerohalosphaeraceae bacterium]